MLGITLLGTYYRNRSRLFCIQGIPVTKEAKGFVLQIRIAGLSEGDIDLNYPTNENYKWIYFKTNG